ncbi:MAG: phosphotransferase [Nanoarchaeota archaeon]|nr:phosphotransferase [Nanoarchaeota archaeon]
MKLTKKQAELISSEYNLGKIQSLKPIVGGWVNYNYELKTDKGKFVVRLLGAKIEKEIRNRLFIEFKLLSHLHKIKFPYEIPYPLKNKGGSYLINIKKTFLWVYPYIEGYQIRDWDNTTIKSVVKALATYHKYVENVRIRNIREVDSLKETSKKYEEMRKQKPNNSVNKLMLENLGFFEESLKKVEKIKFNTKNVPVHYDFHKGNLLFDKKKVVGILDFERLLYTPRILDIAYLIKCTYEKDESKFVKRVNFIVKEYEKINSLTKKEKDLILPMLVRDNCRMFERFYTLLGLENKKISRGNLSCLKWTIEVQRLIINVLGWGIKE